MNIAFLIPGQGEQRPGMLHALPDHPAAEQIRNAAPSPDDADALRSTAVAQLDLYLATTAWAAALAAEGIVPDFVAGHSVGTVTAAVIAGVLSFEQGLAAVRLRGQSMEHRFGGADYGMVAILGLRLAAVKRLVSDANAEASADTRGQLYIALHNAPDQIVLTGSQAALARVPELARATGARQTRALAVPTLSHCPPLAPVADELSAYLATVPSRPPRIPYWRNAAGRLTRNRDEILADLAASVATTVNWAPAVPSLAERGAQLFVALPPGETLARLADSALPRTGPAARTLALEGLSLTEASARIQRASAAH